MNKEETNFILSNANTKYKDTLFRYVFKDEDKLLSLYNALSGRDYTDTSIMEVTTIENCIYLNVYNDLSFIIEDDILNLYEHQSTKNPNIPLRGLFYFSQQYGKIVLVFKHPPKLHSKNPLLK